MLHLFFFWNPARTRFVDFSCPKNPSTNRVMHCIQVLLKRDGGKFKADDSLPGWPMTHWQWGSRNESLFSPLGSIGSDSEPWEKFSSSDWPTTLSCQKTTTGTKTYTKRTELPINLLWFHKAVWLHYAFVAINCDLTVQRWHDILNGALVDSI